MGQVSSSLVVQHDDGDGLNPCMYDLHEMIRAVALEEYMNSKCKKKRSFKPNYFTKNKYDADKLLVVVDYDGLRIEHGSADYEVDKNREEQSDIESNVFPNDTEITQQHRCVIKATRTYKWKYKIEKTLKVGNIALLEVTLPECVLKDNKEDFPESISLKDIQEKEISFKKEFTMDNSVVVPAKTEVHSKLEVIDINYAAWFNVRSTIAGHVTIKLQTKDGKQVAEYTKDIATIVQDHFCKEVILYDESVSSSDDEEECFTVLEPKPLVGCNDDIEWDTKKKLVLVKSEGFCTFTYCKKKSVINE